MIRSATINTEQDLREVWTDSNCPNMGFLFIEQTLEECKVRMGQWEKIPMVADSGAADHVVPTTAAQWVKIDETPAPKAGMCYRRPDSSKISNYGQREISGYTNEWQPAAMKWQVAGVKKGAGSIPKMVEGDNTVVFSRRRQLHQERQVRPSYINVKG